MKNLDDFELDELVSGNLEGEDYRRVLRQVDQDPEGWKRCALAFLEDQAFRKELGQLASSDEIWKASEPVPVPQRAIQGTATPAASAANRQLERFAKFTSIAALLLISFTVGWYGSGLNGTSSSSTNGSEAQVVGNATIGSSPAPNIDPRMQRFESASRAGVQLVDDRLFPVDEVPSYIRSLERSGKYNVETRNSFVPVQVGNEIRLVPVQNLRVKPNGTSL